MTENGSLLLSIVPSPAPAMREAGWCCFDDYWLKMIE
jgi:hypothetical protein